jgi:hypothetical protein
LKDLEKKIKNKKIKTKPKIRKKKDITRLSRIPSHLTDQPPQFMSAPKNYNHFLQRTFPSIVLSADNTISIRPKKLVRESHKVRAHIFPRLFFS